MSFDQLNYEKTRQELKNLIIRHKRTRAWFWRTGASSLVAAALWIIMYNALSDQYTLTETIAVILGATLMWLLFAWAFFLFKKLNLIIEDIRRLERKLEEFTSFSSHSPENVKQS